MDEILGGQVNQCFEMASSKATEYAGMYGVGGEQIIGTSCKLQQTVRFSDVLEIAEFHGSWFSRLLSHCCCSFWFGSNYHVSHLPDHLIRSRHFTR